MESLLIVLRVVRFALIVAGIRLFVHLIRTASPSDVTNYKATIKLFGRQVSCGLIYFTTAGMLVAGFFVTLISFMLIVR